MLNLPGEEDAGGDGGVAALALGQSADPSVLRTDTAARVSDLSDHPTAPALAPKASPPKAARAKQPDWRRKYREEIARLRVEAAALSEAAARLRAVACNRSGYAEGDAGEPLAGNPPSAAALWARIATRQHARRVASEQENARLRAEVEQRRKEARELRRAVLLKRASIQGIRDVLGAGWLSRTKDARGESGVSDDARVFESLRGELDALYAETDAVFERSRVANLRCPDRAIQIRASESRQLVWEFVDVHAVPFDRAATARALWLTFGERSWQQQRGSDVQYEQVGPSECTTRVRFRMSVPVLSIDVLTRKATKRFVERGRVVFVSCSVHQPFFNGKLSSRAAVFREVDRTVVYDAGRREAPRSEIRRHITATTGGEGIAQVAIEGPDWKATDRYSAGVHAWKWAITRDSQAIQDELLRGATRQH